jgi:UDP-2-acetamido-3-amino-2,3-dideoxy-glucuronate N-acetyltransferase
MEQVKIHETAYVDHPVSIGSGTKIWHFSHISAGADIGESCVFGQNVFVGNDVKIGDRVKVQNNVSIYTGCELEDEVFLGPCCVLTNVTNPRSQVNRHSIYEKTLFKRGCTIGANATIVCGITIGRYAFIGAGSVVTKDVSDYALVLGSPAKQKGWMSRHGHRLTNKDEAGIFTCPESGFRYRSSLVSGREQLSCLDLDEEVPLPEGLDYGIKTYDEFKNRINQPEHHVAYR